MILACLAVVISADFTFLLNQTGFTLGDLCIHTGKLEAEGHVEVSKEFVDRIARALTTLTRPGRNAIDEYRQNMRQIIDRFLA